MHIFISTLSLALFSVSMANAQALPEPSDALIYQLKESMVKIGTTTKSGGHGFGTGIAISKEHVVTNCHVLGNANGVSISKWGTEYQPESLQSDWKHDLCILKVLYADLKPVALGDSNRLSYEQPIISISMPNDSPAPYVALSNIKALYPMDNEWVIRSQAAFSIGASGSPVFDYDGKLIGISTFKSPGKNAYFYNMPVNMVKAILQTTPVELSAEHPLPFWDAPESARPFFMQIVLPFQANRWEDVKKIAEAWVKAEPDSAEAWYYFGAGQQHLNEPNTATQYFQKALTLHPDHPASLQALAEIAKVAGNTSEVARINTVLQTINPTLLENLDAQ